jgi:hypothetical protein
MKIVEKQSPSRINACISIASSILPEYIISSAKAIEITGIAKVVGVEPPRIKEIYLSNGASYDEVQDVYYFGSAESANRAVSEITMGMDSNHKGRLIFLTEAEVEYIRKALINENVNTIHVKNRVKDDIFRKLNK